jgi:hypothetical protein
MIERVLPIPAVSVFVDPYGQRRLAESARSPSRNNLRIVSMQKGVA